MPLFLTINTRESREDSVLWPLGMKLSLKTWSPTVWSLRLEVEELTLKQRSQRANNKEADFSNKMLQILAKICQTRCLQVKLCRHIKIKFPNIKTCTSKWCARSSSNHRTPSLNQQSFLHMAKFQINNLIPDHNTPPIKTTDSLKKEEIRGIKNRCPLRVYKVTIENNKIVKEEANQIRKREKDARIWEILVRQMCQIRHEKGEIVAIVVTMRVTKDRKKIIDSRKIGESSEMNSMEDNRRPQVPLIKAIMWNRSRKIKRRAENKKKRELLSLAQSKEKQVRRKTQHLQTLQKKSQTTQRSEPS